MKNDHYTGALLEDIDSKLDIILEGQAAQATSLELKDVGDRLTKVEDEVKLIRRIVTDESRDQRKLTVVVDKHARD